ncbi:hypothetical protein ACFCYB_28715, partial [Streptomyces sp. NPDC056309]|uniref:hypothetical protein n=1 Tax=Streptomyces sp. NPDC056309 TaxID=3345781 RepID=UPI0035E0A789
MVFERARAELNRIAAKTNRPPKQKAPPLTRLHAWWKTGAILISGAAVDVIDSLLERAGAAAVAIQSGVPTWCCRSAEGLFGGHPSARTRQAPRRGRAEVSA